MKKKKNPISSFNLAFLDIMFCGFGAVVLLVLIINSQIVSDNKIKVEDLTADVLKVKNEIKIATDYHNEIKQKIMINHSIKKEQTQQISQIKSVISHLNIDKLNTDEKTQQLKKQIADLETHLKTINNDKLKKQEQLSKQQGKKIRSYEGTGHRQYLTGLKLGGKRVLILLDSSASMLDETIVNIIVKKNQSDKIKKSAQKWQQAVNTVRWLVANLPQNSQFMIAHFNEKTTALINQSWLKSNNSPQVNQLMKNLSNIVPGKGTNLLNAFSFIKNETSRPDNVILITDGLPTLGRNKTSHTKISPTERIKLFNKAIKVIPTRIPINIILLPIEGDPMATSLFWKLAISSHGSFMTPSRDWP